MPYKARKEQLYGKRNHTLFWEIMKPGGAKEPTYSLAKAIANSCKDFSTFKEHFNAKAMGRFGSGWVWLVKEIDGSVTILDTPNQDPHSVRESSDQAR
jgi:Fe-Mn family superoxide dismutase